MGFWRRKHAVTWFVIILAVGLLAGCTYPPGGLPDSGSGISGSSASEVTEGELEGVWKVEDFDERYSNLWKSEYEEGIPVSLIFTGDGYLYLNEFYDATDIGVFHQVCVYTYQYDGRRLTYTPVELYTVEGGDGYYARQENYPEMTVGLAGGSLALRLRYEGSKRDNSYTLYKTDEAVPDYLTQTGRQALLDENEQTYAAIRACAAEFGEALGLPVTELEHHYSIPYALLFEADGVQFLMAPAPVADNNGTFYLTETGYGQRFEAVVAGGFALAFVEYDAPEGWPEVFTDMF